MADKLLIWLGDSREAIRAFPAVYVLHAFEKRTRRTPKDAVDLARHRLRLLLNQRAHRKG